MARIFQYLRFSLAGLLVLTLTIPALGTPPATSPIMAIALAAAAGGADEGAGMQADQTPADRDDAGFTASAVPPLEESSEEELEEGHCASATAPSGEGRLDCLAHFAHQLVIDRIFRPKPLSC